VPNHDRYSIGCILFRKELWAQINDGGTDDEHMLHQYCKRTNQRIVCARSVPFVHLAYFSQREENRDIVETARKFYEPRLGHSFPIAMRASRLLEIEARLRWLDGQGLGSAPPLPVSKRGPVGKKLLYERHQKDQSRVRAELRLWLCILMAS
jgi:hypothetical protein